MNHCTNQSPCFQNDYPNSTLLFHSLKWFPIFLPNNYFPSSKESFVANNWEFNSRNKRREGEKFQPSVYFRGLLLWKGCSTNLKKEIYQVYYSKDTIPLNSLYPVNVNIQVALNLLIFHERWSVS